MGKVTRRGPLEMPLSCPAGWTWQCSASGFGMCQCHRRGRCHMVKGTSLLAWREWHKDRRLYSAVGVVDCYFCRESCLDGIRVLTEGGQLSSLAKDTHIHMLPSVGTQSCSKDVHSHFIGSLIKKQVFLTSGRWYEMSLMEQLRMEFRKFRIFSVFKMN